MHAAPEIAVQAQTRWIILAGGYGSPSRTSASGRSVTAAHSGRARVRRACTTIKIFSQTEPHSRTQHCHPAKKKKKIGKTCVADQQNPARPICPPPPFPPPPPSTCALVLRLRSAASRPRPPFSRAILPGRPSAAVCGSILRFPDSEEDPAMPPPPPPLAPTSSSPQTQTQPVLYTAKHR